MGQHKKSKIRQKTTHVLRWQKMTVEWDKIKQNRGALKAANPNFVSKTDIWKSIRSHCLECKGSFAEVSSCDGHDWVGQCPLNPFRFGKHVGDGKTSKKALRVAIRDMCQQCLGGLVRCGSRDCLLVAIRWPKIVTGGAYDREVRA
jgi:hypothetical protein